MQAIIALLGRWCLSVIFIVSGVYKIFSWQDVEQNFVSAMCETASYYYQVTWLRDAFEIFIPRIPLLLIIATTIEIVGGLLIFIGIQVRLGAFLLLLLLIPTTFFFHHFWTVPAADRALQMAMFMKNLSIFGGLLLVLAHGKGCKKSRPPKEKVQEEA